MTSVCLNLGRFIKHNMCEIIDTNLRAETGDGQLERWKKSVHYKKFFFVNVEMETVL